MAGGLAQLPTPPPQSILSASTHQQPNFEDRFAAAVASTLPNRASPTSAKIPEVKIKGFLGRENKWVDFHRSVCAAMELTAFSPESKDLITTTANQEASCRLRALLVGSLEGNAAQRFDNRPQFKNKGFEMVTFLRQVHAPTGEFALTNILCSLSDMEMKTGEALESYMQRSCILLHSCS